MGPAGLISSDEFTEQPAPLLAVVADGAAQLSHTERVCESEEKEEE